MQPLGRCLAAGLAAFLVSGVPALARQPGADDPQSSGVDVEMFNGEDLDGWVVEGVREYEQDGERHPVWTVEDGCIVCAGRGYGFLRYDRRLDDFEWHVEYRLTPGGNSGLGIRGVPFTGERNTRPSFAGYEIQILDDAGREPDNHCTGSLYRYIAPSEIPVRPSPEWNTIDVRCQGPHIRVTINDVTVIDVDQREHPQIADKPLEGYVSLQNHGSRIDFRNLRLRDLSADRP